MIELKAVRESKSVAKIVGCESKLLRALGLGRSQEIRQADSSFSKDLIKHSSRTQNTDIELTKFLCDNSLSLSAANQTFVCEN